MSTATQSIPAFAPASRPLPAAAFEVLAYLGVVAIATLCFLLGWLGINGAVVLCTLLLLGLTVLAWNRFDGGRHPCFLFLSTLLFFQGGGLLAYCLGAGNDPLRVQIMTPNAFYLSRDEAGIVLFLIAISAICIYAPCRWNYRQIVPPRDINVRRYLPYLYLLFFLTLPIQLFKNYRYYEYAREHGGYTFIYVDHAALAASVPFLVRVVPLITLPTLVAIFVFEQRKKYLWLVTALYFSTASFILLLGSRVAVFTLILALWYVGRIKSTGKARVLKLLVVGLALMMLGEAINREREGEPVVSAFSPLSVLALQGASLNVTEVAVKYRKVFAPYAASYLWNELKNAFVASDAGNYFRGRALGFDISVLLNPAAFSQGFGTGGSYLAEAYVIGGLAGVVLISLLIGSGLHLLYRLSERSLSLFAVAMILPDIIFMPRGGLLDWLSVLLRIVVSILLLLAGWSVYCAITAGATYTRTPPVHHRASGC